MPEEKLSSSKGSGSTTEEEIILLLFGLLILSTLAARFSAFFNDSEYFDGPISYQIRHYFVSYFLPKLEFVALIISGVSIAGIAYNLSKLNELNAKLNVFYSTPKDISDEGLVNNIPKNKKWQRVLTHMQSTNQSDWKLAILEADIMLEELLDAAKFPGETISEKLKNIEQSDFNTIEAAWEAHKVRNSIAHRGADFAISKNEAQRVITLYKAVFDEFYYI